ncbi:MAG: hypothetical protein FJ318_06925 [SAR202 cluster bacterium]|nr:hypothetical protein [SAR202 cluster bacterium]
MQQPPVTPAQQEQMDAYVEALARHPFANAPPSIAPDLLALLARQGRVVRVGDVVFEARTYAHLADEVIARLRERGTIGVDDVREMVNGNRKYAMALLERLDQEKVTRRLGGGARALAE